MPPNAIPIPPTPTPDAREAREVEEDVSFLTYLSYRISADNAKELMAIAGRLESLFRHAQRMQRERDALLAELDAVRAPTEAMVERAAQVLWGGGATPSGYVEPWRDRYAQWQHADLLTRARHALTAAREGGPQ